jgi:DNA replication protein DnaC
MAEAMQTLIARSREQRLREEANGEFRTAPVEPEVCAVCAGARVVRKRTADKDHPDFGVYFSCPACARDERTVEQKMRAFGFNWVKTFDQWQDGGPSLDEARGACLDVIEDKRWVVFLRGGVGCGKTHLAVATAYKLVEAGKTAVMWNVPDLLDAIRSCYDKGAEQAQYDFLQSQIYNRDVIVLDDLGANKPTAWSNAMLYEIVDKLYRARDTKKLIVTTNLGPGEEGRLVFEERIVDGRLMSRIRPGEVVIEGAKDRRREFDR